MQSVNITAYAKPEGYQLSTLDKPIVTDPTDVVIKVHASSINPIDVKKADGAMKMALKDTFPYKIGYDCAGIVTEVGGDVSSFKAGDEVYVRLPESHRGSWSEYAKCPDSYVAAKPKSVSFVEASSIPLAAMTGLQALRKYQGSLEGKTVFVPAGLSGTGAYACQLAKNVFRAGKVITTVSTSKVRKVPELLGDGVVDQIIDYTKSDLKDAIPKGSVDFIFDTTGQAMAHLSLMKPKTGCIVSISTTPSGTQMQNSAVASSTGSKVPALVVLLLNTIDGVRKARAWRWSVNYEYMFLSPNGKDLEELRAYVEAGKLRPVVGQTASFSDIDDVRKVAMLAYTGKGGIGKTVIKIIDS